MIERRECSIETLVMIEDCASAIYIERGAELLRSPGKIDIFAIKFSVAISKRMHKQL